MSFDVDADNGETVIHGEPHLDAAVGELFSKGTSVNVSAPQGGYRETPHGTDRGRLHPRHASKRPAGEVMTEEKLPELYGVTLKRISFEHQGRRVETLAPLL